MNPLTRFSLLVACLWFVVVSCEEPTDVAPASFEPLSSSIYLDNKALPPVLFQYAYHKHESDELRGFVIDKTGEIRTYSLAETPFEYKQETIINVPRSRLENMLAASEASGTFVDLDELAGYVRAIRNSGAHDLTREDLDASATFTQSYYAFGLPNRHSSGSCKVNSSEDMSLSGFSQIPLQSEGKRLIQSTSFVTPGIVKWMQASQPLGLTGSAVSSGE